MSDLPAYPTPGSAAARSGARKERRDVERAIEHWHRNTWGSDCIPLLDAFDFASFKGDWAYRFVVCGDLAVEHALFVAYGSGFAQLLGLPDQAMTAVPFIEQVPEHYREMFFEGYSKAIRESLPVALEGSFDFESRTELFRAVFMPIMLHPSWSKQLVVGSFNRRAVGTDTGEPLNRAY